MAQYKPYEAPDFMKQYSETATTPFARSALGQFLANKQAEEIMNDRYEQPVDADMPETGVPEEAGDVLGQALNKGWIGGLIGKSGLKGLSKIAPKLATKAGLRMIPGVGWALGAADLVDYYGMPIYDYLPGEMGDYMTWRDTTEGEQ